MNVAVVGCGLVGMRRAERVTAHAQTRLACVVDVNEETARATASRLHTAHATDWRAVVGSSWVDSVVVATPNAFLHDVAVGALRSGKHVLVEKPMGRNVEEASSMAAAAGSSILKVGFNHRYHPAIWRAHVLFEEGTIGSIINLRARYGHGGRPGYEKEWRGDASLAGGGELTDQGVHICDLAQWFLGVPQEAFACTQTAVWPIAPLEDNAFGMFRYPNGAVAWLHTSWTQWKNLFSFEVFGTLGSLVIEGLGGSYGVETLTIALRQAAGGAPLLERVEFVGPDRSWDLEWDDFVRAILDGSPYLGTPEDGVTAMQMLDALYASARENRPVLMSRPRRG